MARPARYCPDEDDNVRRVLNSGQLAAGPFVERFESDLGGYLGVNPEAVIAVQSGTAALHLAVRAAGVVPGDIVIVPDLTFVATANAVRYCGATPVCIGPDPYLCMNANFVGRWLADNCWHSPQARETLHWATRQRVSAIIPVHVLGHPARMDHLYALAQAWDLQVIEDCAQALGTMVNTNMDMKTIRCYSFNATKLITTAGGGAVVTSAELRQKMVRHWASQAKQPGSAYEYFHDDVGYNYRMGELNAAVGVAQLEHIDEHLAAKWRIAAAYRKAFEGAEGVAVVAEPPWGNSSWWLPTIRLAHNQVDTPYVYSRRLIRILAEQGIETRPLWRPMHGIFIEGHERINGEGREETAEAWMRCVSLPASVGMTDAEVLEVAEAVKDYVREWW